MKFITMQFLKRPRISKSFLLVLITFFGTSCAYFNTFYNAQKYFEKAETEIRNARDPSTLSKQSKESLELTIEKCKLVLLKYPESKYVDDALMLMGKAQYYRGEYLNAKETLNRLLKEEGSPFIEEAELWILLSQWKLDGAQSVVVDINKFINTRNIRRKNIKLIRLAKEMLGYIYLELGQVDKAISEFNETIELIRDKDIKARLYYQMADLSFKQNRLNDSKKYYKQVIKTSDRTKDIENSYLQIVKILREQGKWEETIDEIQTLIADEKFKEIRPQLYLELGKLYESRSMINEATNRYKLITEEFPKTESSAEAYFLLGMLMLNEYQNYEQSKKYFQNVSKEKRKSIYVPISKIKIKEIDALLQAKEKISELTKMLQENISPSNSQIEVDTSQVANENNYRIENRKITASDSINGIQSIEEELGNFLYSYAELLSFHFNQPDSGMKIFEQFITNLKQHKKRPQALFSLIYLYQQRGDTVSADKFSNELITQYSTTEYAQKIMTGNENTTKDSALVIFHKAENVFNDDPDKAIKLYKQFVSDYPSSRYIPNALLAIAYIFDYKKSNLDSAMSSYQHLIQSYPNTEQAQFAEGRYQQLIIFQSSIKDSVEIDSVILHEN